jgi:hypothetical protein
VNHCVVISPVRPCCAALLGLAYEVLVSEAFLSVSTVAPRSASSAGNVLGTRGVAAKLAVD